MSSTLPGAETMVLSDISNGRNMGSKNVGRVSIISREAGCDLLVQHLHLPIARARRQIQVRRVLVLRCELDVKLALQHITSCSYSPGCAATFPSFIDGAGCRCKASNTIRLIARGQQTCITGLHLDLVQSYRDPFCNFFGHA